MSSLKGLQTMPGVITIFHSPKSATSVKIVHLLEKNIAPLKNAPPKKTGFFSKLFGGMGPPDGKFRYFIDLAEELPPTPEQYQFIKTTLSTHPMCKRSFKQAFPKWGETLNLVSDEINLPRTSEYSKVIEGKSLAELIDEGIFHAPLVVDWDNKLIAADKESTEKLLTTYRNNNSQHDQDE